MRSKEQVMRDANLDALPDDEFMVLLERIEARQAESVAGNAAFSGAVEYTPARIVEEMKVALVARSLAELIARARAQSGVTLEEAGREIGVSKARISQLERSENIEVATLVRLAGAMGYRVRIELEPTGPGKKPLQVELDGRRKP